MGKKRPIDDSVFEESLDAYFKKKTSDASSTTGSGSKSGLDLSGLNTGRDLSSLDPVAPPPLGGVIAPTKADPPSRPSAFSDDLSAFDPQGRKPDLSGGEVKSQPVKPTRSDEYKASLASGLDMLGSMAAKLPSYLIDTGMKATGHPMMQALDAEDMGKLAETQLGIDQKYNPLSPNNGVAELYEQRAKENAAVAQGSFAGGIEDAVKQGKYAEAGHIAAKGIIQSLPIMLGLAASRGAGASEAMSLVGMGMGTAAEEYKNLKAQNPQLDKNLLFMNSLITGASEAGSELAGTSMIYNQAKKLFLKGSEKQAEEVLRKGIGGFLDKAFTRSFVGTSMFSEGFTEGVNALVKNATDKWSGVDPDRDYTDGVLDAFVIGAGAGGTFAAPFAAASAVVKKANKSTIKKLSAEQAKIEQYLDHPDISPEAKAKMAELHASNNERINALMGEDRQAQKVLNPEEQARVQSINADIDAKEAIVSDPTIPAPVREETQASIEQLEDDLNGVVEAAEKRAEQQAKESAKTTKAETKEDLLAELDAELEKAKLPEAESNNDPAPLAGVAVEYLLDSGPDTILSTDYFLQALSGAFRNAGGAINKIRTKYASELAATKQDNLKDFLNTPLYNRIVEDIRSVIGTSYTDKAKAEALLDQVLQHPTGLPSKLGKQVSTQIDALHEDQIKPESNSTEKGIIKPEAVSVQEANELEQLEFDQDIAPIADEMVKVENALSNAGFELNNDYDDAIQILNKKTGEQIEDPDELPEELHEMVGQYEEALQKLSGYGNMGKHLKEARDRFQGEETPYEEVSNQLPESTQTNDQTPTPAPAEAPVPAKPAQPAQKKADRPKAAEVDPLAALDAEKLSTDPSEKNDSPEIEPSIEPAKEPAKKTAKQAVDEALAERKAKYKLQSRWGMDGATEKDDHETGNKRPEKNFKADLDRFSKALAEHLGFEHEADMKGKPIVSRTNVAPAGGDGTITLFKPGSDWGVYINWRVDRAEDGEELESTGELMYRMVKRDGFTRGNQWAPAGTTVSEIAQNVSRQIEALDKKAEPKDDVPAEIREIAKQSPNVSIVSVPKANSQGSLDSSQPLSKTKQKLEGIDKEIEDAFKDFAQSIGKSLGSNGLSAESIEKGIKLVSLYTQKGVYQFADIMEDAYARFGQPVLQMLGELKTAYFAYASNVDDATADQLSDLKEVRKYTVENLTKTNNDNTTGILPDPIRPDQAPVDAAEQSGPAAGTVEQENPEEVSEPGGGTSLPDAGGSPGKRNAGGRGARSNSRAAGPGKRSGTESRADQSETDDGDSGRTRPLAGTPEANMVIPEGMQVVPDGAIGKLNANMEAIVTLMQLEAENRNATAEEKTKLAQFVGWGGLAKFLEGDRSDKLTQAIFSGEPTQIGYSWNPPTFTPSGKLEIAGKTFNQIVEAFRAEYNRALEDPQIRRYLISMDGGIPLEKARQQVIANLLSEEEFNAAKVSTENAHYTEGSIIRGMWDLAKELGFNGGTVLESSAGIGHFFGMMPTDLAQNSQGIGVELDSLTGRMLKKLYPENQIFVKGFQDVNLSPGSVDFAIGNVPFASTGRVYDPQNKDIQKFSLHNYFIAKNLRLLKPGGIAMLITSKATMDNASSNDARRWFASTAGGNSDLIGAIRLPNNAFDKNAGTQVTTDVLIFRKRTSDIANTEPFFSTVNIRSEMVQNRQGEMEKADIEINEYFQQHPDHMIGEMKFAKEVGSGGLYSEFDATLHAPEGTDILGRFKEIGESFPKGIFKAEPTREHQQKKVFSDEKAGKIFLDKKGNIMLSLGEEAEAAEFRYNTHKVVARDYIPLRDAIYPLLEAELNPESTEEQIEPLRGELNKQYDAFAKKHQSVAKHSSWLFEMDVDYPLVAALESVKERSEFNEKGKLVKTLEVTKGDLLTKRVNFPVSEPTKAENFEDAIRISTSYKGHIDLPYVAFLMGTTEADAKAQMLAQELVFENPGSGLLETNDQYLSGPVRTKLEQAQAAAETNPEYNRNVKALEAVQPKLIPAGGIDFKIGVSYLPVEIYQQFIEDTLGVQPRIKFIESIGQWELSVRSGHGDARNQSTYAVGNRTGFDILSDAMSNRTTTITKEIGWGSDKKRVVDEVATAAAADMQEKINQEFQRYVKKNEQYREILEDEYNKRFNNYVEPKTSLPTFEYYPGASRTIKLRLHQMKAVLRALSGNTLFAHSVGTGKTFTQITTAMEMRRLGLAKKPMIVVKNSTLNDFAASFKKLYPTAKILVLSKDQINAKNRKLFMGRIPTGDWDAVIIPHSQFDMIPDRPERVMGYLRQKIEEMQEILSQTDDQFLRKRMEKEIEGLEEQMESMLLTDEDKKAIREAGERAAEGEAPRSKARSAAKKQGEKIARLTASVKKLTDRKTDNILHFEDMGVDALIVDESHSYKRLGFQTNIQKVKGIDVAASKKAVSAYLKTQAVMERTGGKNVIFATGTPVTNTMAELWTNMRFLIPDTIREMGITTFDQFQQTFTEVEDSIEQNAGGNFEAVQRLSNFYNVPELIRTFRRFADVVSTDDIPEFKEDPDNAPPQLKGGKPQTVVLKMTDTLKGIMQTIAERYREFKEMGGKEKRANSWRPLILYYIGKVAPIDPRLINPFLPDDPGSKANAAVREILRLYKESGEHKGTQMVFSDSIKSSDAEKVRELLDIPRGGKEFNLYEDLREKLIAGGIPAQEIAILTDSKYDKDEAKKKLFDMVNEGTVRVVIGSTEKMGVGVNAQERMIGLHHLDAPGRPDMYTQRNGRILRQGNMFAKLGKAIEIMAYGMEGTRDATAFQRLEKKQGFITQLFKGNVTERRMGDEAAEEQENIDDFFAELGASLSGNKDALKLVMVKRDLRKEENRQQAYKDRLQDAELALRKNEQLKTHYTAKIEEAEGIVRAAEQAFPDGKIAEVEIGGVTYTEKLGEVLVKELLDPAVAEAEATNKAGGSNNKRVVFKIHGLEASVYVRVWRGSDPDYFLRIEALGIGTASDDRADDKGRKLESPRGLLNVVRNQISAAPEKPDEYRAKKANAEKAITQLQEDLKETFDDTKLEQLRRDKRILDARLVGGKMFEVKSEDGQFYLYNTADQTEVVDDQGEPIYYKNQADAQAEATRRNQEAAEAAEAAEAQENPHANIQGALDALDNLKVKPGQAFSLLVPVPPAVWNGAIDVLKAALKATNSAQKAIRAGLNHMREKGANQAQMDQFESHFGKLLADMGYEDRVKRTSLRNADVEDKREEYGFAPPRQRRGMTNAELEDRARKEIKKGLDMDELMDKILVHRQPIEGWESVALALFQAQKEAELLEINAQIEANPQMGTSAFMRLSEARDKTLDDMQRAYDASEAAGTVAANALRARQVKVSRDMSLAGMIARMRKANKGEALTPEETRIVMQQHKELQDLLKKIEAKNRKLEEDIAKLKAERTVKKAARASVKSSRAATIVELKKEFADIKQGAREALRQARRQTNSTVLPYLNELVALAPYVAKAAANLTKQGYVQLQEVVDKLHEEFVEEVPELTPRDVLDILGGKYHQGPKTKAEINQELDELKKQARLVGQIQDAEQGLKHPHPAKQRQASEEVQKLRQRLKALRSTEAEEKHLQAAKDRLRARIDELNRRIQEGDFEPAAPREPRFQDDAELIALKDAYNRAKQDFDVAVIRRELASRTRAQKWADGLADLLNMPRSLMSSMDFSAPMRQGVALTVSHPVLALKAMKEMFLQSVSQPRFDRWLHDLQDSPEFELMQKSGLYIANLHNARLSAREERMMSNLAERVPLGIGKMVKGSERAYIGYLNNIRAAVFLQMAASLNSQGYTIQARPELFEAAASFVNNASGRGNMGKTLNQAAPLLNAMFFSPRLMASRLNLINPAYYARVPKELRGMIYRDMGIFFGAALGLLALIDLGFDDEEDMVEWNPLSADFGKLKVGDSRYDLMYGFGQYIRFVAQMVTGKKKSTTNGSVYEAGRIEKIGKDFFRSKLAPIPSMAWNLDAGEDMVGKEYTYRDIPKSFVPMISTDVYESLGKNPAGKIILDAAIAATGISVQQYEQRQSSKPKIYYY